MANPWIVTEETKSIAQDNIVYLLRNFPNCSEYKYVIFSWIFRRDVVFNLILDKLKDYDFHLHKITLTCDEKVFQERLEEAGRKKDNIQRCIDSVTLCDSTGSLKVDTTNVPISDVANTPAGVLIETGTIPTKYYSHPAHSRQERLRQVPLNYHPPNRKVIFLSCL